MENKQCSEPLWVTKIMEIFERINNEGLKEGKCASEKEKNVNCSGPLTQEPRFDFLAIAHSCLVEKSDHGFLRYHDTYKVLGQRFCFRKTVAKNLLNTMAERGTLVMKKRGIQLI
jgi:hypothetical protein